MKYNVTINVEIPYTVLRGRWLGTVTTARPREPTSWMEIFGQIACLNYSHLGQRCCRLCRSAIESIADDIPSGVCTLCNPFFSVVVRSSCGAGDGLSRSALLSASLRSGPQSPTALNEAESSQSLSLPLCLPVCLSLSLYA